MVMPAGNEGLPRSGNRSVGLGKLATLVECLKNIEMVRPGLLQGVFQLPSMF